MFEQELIQELMFEKTRYFSIYIIDKQNTKNEDITKVLQGTAAWMIIT